MPDIQVCDFSAMNDPGRKVVDAGGMEIGIFRLAMRCSLMRTAVPILKGRCVRENPAACPSRAVARDGTSTGRVFSKQQINVVCPWHGYEFDIRTGTHPTDKRVRLRKLPVRVAEGKVFVTVPG